MESTVQGPNIIIPINYIPKYRVTKVHLTILLLYDDLTAHCDFKFKYSRFPYFSYD